MSRNIIQGSLLNDSCAERHGSLVLLQKVKGLLNGTVRWCWCWTFKLLYWCPGKKVDTRKSLLMSETFWVLCRRRCATRTEAPRVPVEEDEGRNWFMNKQHFEGKHQIHVHILNTLLEWGINAAATTATGEVSRKHFLLPSLVVHTHLHVARYSSSTFNCSPPVKCS